MDGEHGELTHDPSANRTKVGLKSRVMREHVRGVLQVLIEPRWD